MMTKLTIATATGALLLLAMAGPSFAQRPPETTGASSSDTVEAGAPALDRKACADDRRATVGGGGDTVQVPHPEKDLSDKLAKTEGVICPPAEVDPNIHAPAPG